MANLTQAEIDKLIEGTDAKPEGAGVSRTNSRLRQKYFVDEKNILGSMRQTLTARPQPTGKVIHGAGARSLNKPVLIRCQTAALEGDIQVNLIRNGARITGIRIACPCGRHTELNVEYEGG